jgi:hypothetical protein
MAAGNTYTPIATTNLTSAVSSYSFSSIPGTYTDLILISRFAVTSAGANLYGQINSDTATNYSDVWIRGDGSSATTFRDTSVNHFWFSSSGYATTDNPNNITHFQNYSNATTYKTLLIRDSNAGGAVGAGVALWRSTSAISSILIYTSSGNIASGSTFTLYGIQAA